VDCLDANAVQDLMSDALAASARQAVMAHLDTCADCRELVGVIAKDTIRESSQPPSGLEATAVAATSPGIAAHAATVLSATRSSDTDLVPTRKISVGQTLGRYTLVEKLGSGAMGVVFRAEDRELSRDVAVKVLHRPDDALTERLVREARSMAQVNHPNVVAVYDVGTTDAITYIAMELVPGTSLRAWQQTQRTASEILVAYVAAGRGLAAAHRSGIVHRDFKPDNVLLGKDGRVRVTDFGLAASRATDGVEPDASLSGDLSLTRSGTVMGTPAYMAPEQFEGGNVDARTDQFNFCVALYEALYGERPFVGKSFEDLYDSVASGKVRPAPAESRVSNAVRAIVLRGLAVKPGDRYPTMGHLLDDLARDRAKPWRRASIAAASLAVLLGVGFAADWAIRSRLTEKTQQAFEATAKQTDQTARLIVKLNEVISSQAYVFSAMIEVSAYREDSDFGLGEASTDKQELDLLHQKLASATWDFASTSTIGGRPNIIAVGDYKGRLLFTTAAPELLPLTDLTQLPWIAQAIETGRGNAMRILRNDDPQLVATKLLGEAPSSGMSVLFARTGTGGTSLFIQLIDIDDVLAYMKMGTLLSIVTPEGEARGDVPPALLAEMPENMTTAKEVTLGRQTYQVLAKDITGPDGTRVGRVVMASRIDGVLSLFPHARTVFAVAMLAAFFVAVAMFQVALSRRA
jgi:serine/threonine protein kinase